MSDPRLLIAIEVLDFLRSLRPKEQAALLKRSAKLRSFPHSSLITWNVIRSVGAWKSTSSAGLRSSIGMIMPTGT